MKHYYNEFDPKAAEWLRELIKEGHLPDGDVDERDIQDVRPEELMGYTQCHFFAGIGGWPLALRIAGISTTTRLWTGSCPCQPFSAAGKGAGADDERHLWPSWQWLIGQCKPDIVFGEQVASKAGREWFATVQTDLQNMGYAATAADICAAGVGAPHWRQRLWFVGIQHTPGDGWEGRWSESGRGSASSGCGEGRVGDTPISSQWTQHGEPGTGGQFEVTDRRSGVSGELAQSDCGERDGRTEYGEDVIDRETGRRFEGNSQPARGGTDGGMADTASGEPGQTGTVQPGGKHGLQPQSDGTGELEDAGGDRRDGQHTFLREGQDQDPEAAGRAAECTAGPDSLAGIEPFASAINGFWSDADWILCTDGKWRPVEPGSFPLAHGVSDRVGLLRGYGNAIVPQVAATFIEAVMG